MDEERLAAYERRSGWPLTVAAVVFLVAYVWPVLDPGLPPGIARACAVANVAIWVLFGVDLAVRVVLAPRRLHFLRHHLLDLVVLALPLLRPLRALRVVSVLARMSRTSVSFRGQTMTYVAGAVLLIGFVAAVAVLDVERGSPDANITDFGDALWWTAATVTSVGYGDEYPTTAEGRWVGVGLMTGGIALLGVVTASLASWFVEKIGVVERGDAHTRAEVSELAAEVRALRTRLGGGDGTPPDPGS